MNEIEINRMLKEKGNPCLSIIIPTIQYTRERMQNPERIEKAITSARNLVAHSKWSAELKLAIHEKLDTVINALDYMRLQDGLAIFISPAVARSYLLPFPVKEKIILDESFEVRDLLYYQQMLRPYYLLTTSRKRVRFLKGSGRDLQEVVNHDFPMMYVDEYEYEHPSIGSSSSQGLKGFERDKSVVVEDRLKFFYKHVGDTLKRYLQNNVPVFLAGTIDDTTTFTQSNPQLQPIHAIIRGNYDVNAIHPLAQQTWEHNFNLLLLQAQELIQCAEEERGMHRVAEGIVDVWRAAREGKGRLLLVEKDYQRRGYRKKDQNGQLLLSPPTTDHVIIADAVDDVIETVLQKGGEVFILENDALVNFNRIALILRYAH